VNQLDQVTQQNAAMFEQTTAASHSLTCEAETLAATTAQFRIGLEAAAAEPAFQSARRVPAGGTAHALTNAAKRAPDTTGQRRASPASTPTPASFARAAPTGAAGGHRRPLTAAATAPVETDWEDF